MNYQILLKLKSILGIILLLTFTIISCKSKPINKNEYLFSGIYLNHNIESLSDNGKTMLEFLDIYYGNVDSLIISKFENNKIKISFNDENKTKKNIYLNGEFKPEYFEYYKNSEKTGFILVKRTVQIDRVRIYFKSDCLIVERYLESSGNFSIVIATSAETEINNYYSKIK